MRRAALIVDQPPFPPRNGITIPSCQILDWLLSRADQVDLIVLGTQSSKEVDARGARLISIPRHAPSRGSAFLAELFGFRPSFGNWRYNKSLPDIGEIYDLAICTPISALDGVERLGIRTRRLVAAINDVYTAVLSTYDYPSKLEIFVARLRATRMGAMEAKFLRSCDVVLAQTAADVAWLHRIGGNSLAARSAAVHNAVSDELVYAQAPESPPGRNVIFIADLANALYQRNLHWLYTCWRDMVSRPPDAMLRVVGRGLEKNRPLLSMLKSDPSVDVAGFIPDLRQAYSDARVVAAPIFKSYGFMNKVAEAAALGLPVVGDESAFNGMHDLVSMGGGVTAIGAHNFGAALLQLLTDDADWLRRSIAAKSFALQHLTMKHLFERLDEIVLPSSRETGDA